MVEIIQFVDWNRYMRIPWKEGGRGLDGADCYGWLRIVVLEEFGLDLPSWSNAYDGPVSASHTLQAHIDDEVEGLAWSPVGRGEERTLDAAVIWDRIPTSMVHVALVQKPGRLMMMLNHRGVLSQPYNGADIISRFWRDRIVEFRRLA